MIKKLLSKIIAIGVFSSIIITLYTTPILSLDISTPANDPLTAEERIWLDEHQLIRLAPDPFYPPVEFFDQNGQYRGIAADYIYLLEQKLGIKFTVVHLKNWDEIIQAAQAGDIDMLGGVFFTTERQDYLLYSQSFLDPPVVIISRKETGKLNLEQLSYKTVVLVSGYAWVDLVKHDFSDIKLITAPDPATGLKIVSSGMADAMIQDLASSSYYIRENGLSNLQIAGDTPYEAKLFFASRKDWPELQSILNKGLGLISPREKQEIYDKWIDHSSQQLFNQTIIRTIKIVLALLLCTLLLIIIWNRSLQLQVRNKTEELAQEMEEKQQAEMALLISKEKAARYEAEAQKMTTLSVMSAGVAHEISQPLNAIKILADGVIFLDENGQKLDMEKALNTFAEISVQADRINDIIRHIRTLANAVGESSYHPCNLNMAVNSALKIMRHKLSNHAIEIDIELDNAQNLVMGHEHRLEEIVINLLSNAMNALNNNNQENKKIFCSTRQEGDRVILEIADNGPGISPNLEQKIWEPFFSTRNGEQGMGLGLPIIQATVSRLGGTISYYTNNLGGAAFRLELPALPAAKVI